MLHFVLAAQQAAPQIPLAPNGQAMPMQGIPGQAPQDPRQALLSQLNDIQLPEEVGLWPPAPGWWIIAGIVLALLGLVTWQLYKAHRKQRYRRQALKALDKLVQTTEQGSYDQCVGIMQLLKRCFFTAYPASRLQIAGMHSSTWFQLLEDSCKKDISSHAFETAITALLYQNNVGPQAQALSQLYEFAREWIKHHNKPSDALSAKVSAAASSLYVKPSSDNTYGGAANV